MTDWTAIFDDPLTLQQSVWDLSFVLSKEQRAGTIWFWIWGFSAEIMAFCTHPVSWLWVGMSVVLWVIAVVGMRFLDKRYVKVEKE